MCSANVFRFFPRFYCNMEKAKHRSSWQVFHPAPSWIPSVKSLCCPELTFTQVSPNLPNSNFSSTSSKRSTLQLPLSIWNSSSWSVNDPTNCSQFSGTWIFPHSCLPDRIGTHDKSITMTPFPKQPLGKCGDFRTTRRYWRMGTWSPIVRTAPTSATLQQRSGSQRCCLFC